MNLIALLLTFLVGLFIFGGSISQLIFRKNKKLVDFSISISFGVIMSLIAIRLIPEILEISLGYLGIWKGILISSILTFLGFVIIQQLNLFIPHHEQKDYKHKHNCYIEHLKHVGIVSCIALTVYCFIDGMNLYLAMVSDIKLGLFLSFGLALHNVPIGLLISASFINIYNNKKIIIISILISLSTLFGGLLVFISDINSELIMQLLFTVSLGMLIYVGFFELLEQVLRIEDKKTSIVGVVSGIIISIIIVFLG